MAARAAASNGSVGKVLRGANGRNFSARRTWETFIVTISNRPIEAYRVSDSARLGTLPRHFGRYMLHVERKVFDLMDNFSLDYDGGYWHFFELSNSGFYMAPTIERLHLSIPSNGFDGDMTGDAAGITCCLFAFSLLSFEYPNADVFSRHFHWLRDFAGSHAEATHIFGAID